MTYELSAGREDVFLARACVLWLTSYVECADVNLGAIQMQSMGAFIDMIHSKMDPIRQHSACPGLQAMHCLRHLLLDEEFCTVPAVVSSSTQCLCDLGGDTGVCFGSDMVGCTRVDEK